MRWLLALLVSVSFVFSISSAHAQSTGGGPFCPLPAAALADASSTPIALTSSCNVFSWAPSASGHTLAAPSGAQVGQFIDLLISQPGSGGPYTVAWNAAYETPAGVAFNPTLNTGASAVTEIGCKVVATTPVLYCYGPLNGASSQTTVASPTAPSSTSAYQTQGFAAPITPVATGNILITISGTIIAPAGTADTIGVQYQIYYGTGSAPGSNHAVASNCGTTSCTAIGTVQRDQPGATIAIADYFVPFSITAIATGLAIGTAAWVDLGAESIGTASDKAFSNVNVSIVELR